MASRKASVRKELTAGEAPSTPRQPTSGGRAGLEITVSEHYGPSTPRPPASGRRGKTASTAPSGDLGSRAASDLPTTTSEATALLDSLKRVLIALETLLREKEGAGLHPHDLAGPAPPPSRSTLELANDVLEKPGLWLRTPNPRLGDRKPIDLLDTDEEFRVYNVLAAVDQGLFG